MAGEEWPEVENEIDYKLQQFTEYCWSWWQRAEENKTFANPKNTFIAQHYSLQQSHCNQIPKDHYLMPWHENTFILQSFSLQLSSSIFIFPLDSH